MPAGRESGRRSSRGLVLVGLVLVGLVLVGLVLVGLGLINEQHRDVVADGILQVATRAAEGLVFTTRSGAATDPSNLRRELDRATGRAGLGHWYPYELRHTAISLLSDAGVPLERIADMAGHTTTAMVERVYRHPVTESISAGKAAMDEMFGGGTFGT